MRSSKFQKIITLLLCMMMCFETVLPAVALELDENLQSTEETVEEVVQEEEISEEVPEEEIFGEETPAQQPEQEEQPVEETPETEIVETEVVETETSEEALGAAEEAVIDESTFPDANFRAYVNTLAGAEDGVFTGSELDAITEIDCGNKNIASLKGIEYFTNLETLYCYSNKLTSLDVSKNTKIKEISCNGNQLTSINVKGCTLLRNLNCGNNKLTTLDISNNPTLYYVECQLNQLTSVNTENSTALATLHCFDNNLTSLDLSSNTALAWLDCDDNQLTSLVLSSSANMYFLDCNNNNLVCIDVSKYTNLNYFDISNNSREIQLDEENTFDLSTISGFDTAKVSNLVNATISGNTVTVENIRNDITYTYDCGNGFSCEFVIDAYRNADAGTGKFVAELDPNNAVGAGQWVGVILNLENRPVFENFNVILDYDPEVFELITTATIDRNNMYSVEPNYYSNNTSWNVFYEGAAENENSVLIAFLRVRNGAKPGNHTVQFLFDEEYGSANAAGERIYWEDSNVLNIEVIERTPGDVQFTDEEWDQWTLTEPVFENGAYQIGHIEEFVWFAEAMWNWEIPNDSNVVLTDDIDGGGYYFGTEIGEKNRPYLGTFDGQGHTVKNLVRGCGVWLQEEEHGGIFGVVGSANSEEKAVIKNLTLEVTAQGRRTYEIYDAIENLAIGGMIGYAENADIINVSTKINDIEVKHGVTGENVGSGAGAGLGGVIGRAVNCNIKNCSGSGIVKGLDSVGGVVGYAENCTVTNCYNTGAITGKNKVGGIVGEAVGGSINNCFSTGKITGESSINAIAGSNSGTAEDVYYLAGSCANGIGTAMTADEIEDEAFAETLNQNANEIVFQAGYEHPVFTYQEGKRPTVPGGKLTLKRESTESVGAGEIIKVDLYIENNPGFETLNALFVLDRTVFEVIENYTYAPTYCSNSKNEYLFTYENHPDHVDRENYKIVTVTLRVLEGAKLGETSLKFNFNGKLGSVNENGEYLDWENSNSVTVNIVERTNGDVPSDPAWDGGTLTEPKFVNGAYVISHAEELAWFMQNFGDGKIPQDANAVLTQDIDLNDGLLFGDLYQRVYLGVFDGRGYTIKNYRNGIGMSDPDEVIEMPYKGLFNKVGSNSSEKQAEIRNLKLEGVYTVYSESPVNYANTGGIVGYAENAKLIGLVSEVQIICNKIVSSPWRHTGGIAAVAVNCEIKNCANSAVRMIGGDITGGIVGYAENCTITNCYNNGPIEGTNKVGGIVGEMVGDSSMNNCYNTGTITGTNNCNAIAGISNVEITNSYYLKNSGNGTYGTQKSASTMKSASFVTTLNNNAGETVFKKGTTYPEFIGELMGDLVKDGVINTADGDVLYNYLNGNGDLTDEQREKADMNGDGELTLRDAMLIYDIYNA